jgi:hypothetical protein
MNTCVYPGCDQPGAAPEDVYGGEYCRHHAGLDHEHVPEWDTLTIVMEYWPERLVFDIWCGVCGRSGSFETDLPRNVDILW